MLIVDFEPLQQAVADPRDARCAPICGPISFHFHAVFFLIFRCTSLRLTPPLGNPKSAPITILFKHPNLRILTGLSQVPFTHMICFAIAIAIRFRFGNGFAPIFAITIPIYPTDTLKLKKKGRYSHWLYSQYLDLNHACALSGTKTGGLEFNFKDNEA